MKASKHLEEVQVCKVSTCMNLDRICKILQNYHSSSFSKANIVSHTNIICCINGLYPPTTQVEYAFKPYDCTLLLNDFHHLLFNHKDQFQDVYHLLIEKTNHGNICNTANCHMMTRNYRDRDEFKYCYIGNDNMGDIVQQQLLDKIHCYYFHSFDIFFQTKHEEKKEKEEKSCDSKKWEMHKALQSRTQRLTNKQQMERIFRYMSKFTTVADENLLPQYSFGIRYFYSNFYKHATSHKDQVRMIDFMSVGNAKDTNDGYLLSDWYIPRTFANLKVELTNNPLSQLALGQWYQLYCKALKHHQTDHAKTFYSLERKYANRHGVKYGQTITVEHLVAVMTYCNYDRLQYVFTSTYRRIPVTETDDSLKKRHANFANLGRLLRELLECFCPILKYNKKRMPYDDIHTSLTWAKNCMNETFYHGINTKMQFASCKACFKGPLSTTTDYHVAVNFSNPTGILLELQLDQFWVYVNASGTALFDCRWISDYANESEVLFVGGYSEHIIQNIVNVELGEDYSVYLFALHRIFMCLSKYNGFMYPRDPLKEDTYMVKKILLNQLHSAFPSNKQYIKFSNMPCYVKTLINNHFQHVTDLEFWSVSHPKDDVQPIMEQLFLGKNNWLDMTLLYGTFPSLCRILVYSDYCKDFVMDQSVYGEILSYLFDNPLTPLQYIVFDLPAGMNVIQKASEAIQPYKLAYLKIGYELSVYDNWTIHKGHIAIKNNTIGLTTIWEKLGISSQHRKY
eukprot:382442_1